MGAGGAERVALLFETRADLSGAQAVRTETTALGKAAEQATTDAASGNSKLSASIDQVRRAQAASNGDFEKFKQELASIVQQENALAAAAARTTTELQRQARATPGPAQLGPNFAAVSGGRQLGPAIGPDIVGPQLGPAVPGLTAAAAAAESARVKLEKIPPAARQAGNALGLLATAAATGNGSLAGLATAAGNVAQGMSVLSTNAKFAASAAGVGALIASIGILIGVAIEAKRALSEIPEGMLGGASREHIENLTTVAQINREIALTDSRRAALTEQLGRGDKEALQQNVNLGAQLEALYRRRVSLERELREAGKQRAKEEAASAKQRAAEEKTAQDHLYGLRNAAAEAADKATQTEYEQRRRAIERQAADEIRANEQLVQSDDLRRQSLDAINDKRKYGLQLLEKEAEIARRKVIDEGLKGYARLSQAAILHGSIVARVAQVAAEAVRKYEILVQAKKDALMAKSEFAAATAAFARYDVAGGALHLAAAGGYAAAAIAGGAEAVSGGGGASGGSPPSGVSDSGTFQPRGASDAGAQVIILQTVDPYSREKINEVRYLIGRGGTLKQPIQLPPTTGLQGAA